MNMGWHRLIHHRTRENYSSGGARERGGGRAKSQNLCASTAPLVLSSHQRCCFLTAKSTSDSAAFVSLSVQLMCATLNMHLPVSAHILSCLSATWRDEARPGSTGSRIHRISYPIFSPLFIQMTPSFPGKHAESFLHITFLVSGSDILHGNFTYHDITFHKHNHLWHINSSRHDYLMRFFVLPAGRCLRSITFVCLFDLWTTFTYFHEM